MKRIGMVLILMFFSSLCFPMTSVVINRTPPTDCLYNMAKTYYGKPSLWPALKDYNGIADERKIPNGTVIKIPDKSVAQNLMNASTPQAKQNIINGSNSNSSNSSSSASNSSASTSNSGVPSNLDPASPPYKIDKAFGSRDLK